MDTGIERWHFVATGSGVLSSPAVADGMVFTGSSDGRIYALSLSIGKIAWSFRAGERVWASAAIIDGVVFFSFHDGYTNAIESAPQE